MKNEAAKAVVFSDIDGTILDSSYGLELAWSVSNRLSALNTPLVFCSSKTSAEIEHYRKLLGVGDPFISENGGGIFIPKKYFKKQYSYSKETDIFNVIELGEPYSELRRKLGKIKMETGATIVGFGDLSIEDLVKDCSLPLELAGLAMRREYDEPFRIVKGDLSKVIMAAKGEGLTVTKGDRYNHLSGNHDKGQAALKLMELYRREFGCIEAFGVGNSENDFGLLNIVDESFFVDNEKNMPKVWGAIFNKLYLRNKCDKA